MIPGPRIQVGCCRLGRRNCRTRVDPSSVGASRDDSVQNQRRMNPMKTQLTGLAVATLLVIGSTLPGYAQDAPAPAAPAAPAATQTEAPASVARPSIVPKTTQPPSAPLADAHPAPRHRRHAPPPS